MRLVHLVLVSLLAALAAQAAEMERLSVRGKDIVNAEGGVMSMRGINFGGWLMMETWIPSLEMEWHDHLPRLASEVGIEKQLREAEKEVGSFDDDKERIGDYIKRLHKKLETQAPPEKFRTYMALFEKEPSVFAAKDMEDLLRARFGDYGAGEIWNAFHDTWITETDFQLARALGFNFVRIPFWYRWFENDATPYTYNEYGFRYLDRAVGWAREHRLYVMLDFHGAQGCQSPWDHTGELSNARYFSTPEFQKRCAALWKAIAERYRNDNTVFAYDLLNEPFSARDVRNWTEAHDLIYDAIRSVDARTIIVMEDGYKLEDPAYKEKGFFPDPTALGWTNLVYSIHFYSGWDPELTKGDNSFDHRKVLQELMRVGKLEQDRWKVPIYIGEFSTMHDLPNDVAGMKTIMTAFNECGWHYSPWTFKYVNDDKESSIWGVYQYNQPWKQTPNMYRDSKNSILNTMLNQPVQAAR
jgi:aryl-phospho-beta-D-glucosidase BglC (GH1 family)